MKLPRLAACVLCVFALACGDSHDDDETEADMQGVGAACDGDADCEAYHPDSETGTIELSCLPQFTGGYCGIVDCASNEDCPDASACVAHTDGVNYCFRTCLDKSECNVHRPDDAQSNCSSNIEFVDQDTSGKACVPPSSGA